MLESETVDELATLVRAGFYDRERLMEIFCEEMYAPGDLDPDDVSDAIGSEIAKLELEKESWPAVTDCDRLQTAFEALRRQGIIALENAGNTQSDGHEDFRDAYASHADKATVRGYCFYHGQDLEGAVRGCGLFLAFGPANPEDEETSGAVIGNMVRVELERAGLEVAWDGTMAKRIHIPTMVWLRR